MNIKNIKTGQTFKNYKHLCTELEMEVKRGNSKNAQLKELSRYCNYNKIGHSFIIVKVYEKPLSKIDGRGKSEGSRRNIYNNFIQLLILDLLAQCNNKSITVSRNNLLRLVHMTNINYGYCGENVPKLSVYAEIEEAIIYDFYNTSNSSFKSAVDTALKALRDRSVIIYDMVTKVRRIDKKIHSIATEEEREIILECENETLEEFGFEKISEVRCSKYWRKFKEIVKEKLNERSNIDFYYLAYDITISQKYIDKKLNNLADLVLKDVKREEYQNELNITVCAKLLENAQKRHESKKESKMKIHREKDDYIAKIDKLINLLVNHKNTERIKLNDIKLDTSPFEDVEDEFITDILEDNIFGSIYFK